MKTTALLTQGLSYCMKDPDDKLHFTFAVYLDVFCRCRAISRGIPMFRLVSSCRNARMDRIIMTMLTQYSLLEPQCNDQDHVLKVSSILKMGECRMNSQLEQGAKKKTYNYCCSENSTRPLPGPKSMANNVPSRDWTRYNATYTLMSFL